MRQLCEMVNKLRDSLSEVKDVIIPLAQGNLDIDIGAKNFLASPFRQLQSNLRHLTWQVEQIAAGDFNQRVDFMGDFSRAFNAMVIALDKAQREITEKNAELKKERDSLKAMNTLMTGRELRMIELKKEINSLLKEQGRPGKY
jgi:methyl-accepting chemotaxis protein